MEGLILGVCSIADIHHSFREFWRDIRKYGIAAAFKSFNDCELKAADLIAAMLLAKLFERYQDITYTTFRQAWKRAEAMLPELDWIVIPARPVRRGKAVRNG